MRGAGRYHAGVVAECGAMSGASSVDAERALALAGPVGETLGRGGDRWGRGGRDGRGGELRGAGSSNHGRSRRSGHAGENHGCRIDSRRSCCLRATRGLRSCCRRESLSFRGRQRRSRRKAGLPVRKRRGGHGRAEKLALGWGFRDASSGTRPGGCVGCRGGATGEGALGPLTAGGVPAAAAACLSFLAASASREVTWGRWGGRFALESFGGAPRSGCTGPGGRGGGLGNSGRVPLSEARS